VYGIVEHYRNPFPNVIAVHDEWFQENYRNNSLYVNVNVMNFSDVSVAARINARFMVFDENIPPFDPSLPPTESNLIPKSLVFAPWQMQGIHWEIGFKPGGTEPQSLRWAYKQNAMRVALDITYNDGKRDITYHHIGKLIGDHYDPKLIGQIDVVQEERN
jgi:hypothetical protein